MSASGVEQFGAYRKAVELFDHVIVDTEALREDSRCTRLAAQQVDSADSVCANIEEGYGRLGRKEFIRFLDIARGSARETQGRYGRMKHWLPSETIEERMALAGEVIAILTTTINRLRALQNESEVREENCAYGTSTTSDDALTPDT